MRIASFVHDDRQRVGLRECDDIRLCENAQTISDVLGGEVRLGATVPLETVRLLPPVPRPGKILCIGLNYRDHAKEGGNPIPDYPAVFMRGGVSLVAHNGALMRPTVPTNSISKPNLRW